MHAIHHNTTLVVRFRSHNCFNLSKTVTRIRFASVAMTPSSQDTKRKPTEPISPPPVKRKANANISKGAVANFFTPASQKPKERTSWSERAPNEDEPATLLVARYDPDTSKGEGAVPRDKRRKIAAFDLDSTLITTVSGKKFGNEPTDWKWWDPSVPSKLQQLDSEEDYHLIILSNQGGLTLHPDPKSKAPQKLNQNRIQNFKAKCGAILTQLDLPVSLYAATGKDIFRKPRAGMWNELCHDLGIEMSEVNLEDCIFVGDAGGRTAHDKNDSTIAKDFSCSDRNFAHNVGISFKTPEEYFLGEAPRPFSRDFDLAKYPYTELVDDTNPSVVFERKNKQDIVLFCGPPAAGKSTFYWKHLKPLGYERINQDTLKTRAKCLKVAAEHLSEGDSVAIDNTNPQSDSRQEWIDLAQKHKIPIRCVWFKIPKALCEHNDVVRALNKSMNPESRAVLPGLAFNSYYSRFKEPKAKEGFQDVTEVEFRFTGSPEEYAIWGRYWT